MFNLTTVLSLLTLLLNAHALSIECPICEGARGGCRDEHYYKPSTCSNNNFKGEKFWVRETLCNTCCPLAGSKDTVIGWECNSNSQGNPCNEYYNPWVNKRSYLMPSAH